MKSNLSDTVFNEVKTEILFNRLHPGDMLSENELCGKYHVSRTPVRQALQHLEAIGLVEIRDGVGTFVTHITQQQMRDAYEIRRAAEIIAIDTAVEHITDAELDVLESGFLKFRNQLARGGGYGASFEEMVRADWQLHDLIIGRSENALLAEAVEKITYILRRYQMAYVSLYERATEDHLEIVRCIREKDREGARKILSEHLSYRTF